MKKEKTLAAHSVKRRGKPLVICSYTVTLVGEIGWRNHSGFSCVSLCWCSLTIFWCIVLHGLTIYNTCFVAYQQKYAFGQTQVEYLGHVISKEGVVVDPSKVSSVLH